MEPQKCLHCGQTVPGLTHDSHPTHSSTEDEIAFIIKETQRLDDLISQLCNKRATLSRQLNTLRPSTRNLPPEILSNIFQHVLPSLDFTDFQYAAKEDLDEEHEYYETESTESHPQLTLSTISSDWRHIVHSTPRLWTKAIINVARASQKKADLLQLYLEKSQSLPICVELRIDDSLTDGDLQPIYTTIWGNAEKFRILSLGKAPEHWMQSLSSAFRNLEDLRFLGTNTHDLQTEPEPTFHSVTLPRLRSVTLPWLRSVTLARLTYGPSTLPYNSITVLHLAGMRSDICVELLLASPFLIEYQCEDAFTLDDDGPQLHRSFVFPHLKIFRPFGLTYGCYIGVLPHIQMPSLEILRLDIDDYCPGLDHLSDFLSRLPSTCSTVELQPRWLDERILRRAVQSIPDQVQNLHLLDCDGLAFGQLLIVLGGHDGAQPPLPDLRRLHVESQQYSLYLTGGFSPLSNPQLLLDMLTARNAWFGGHLRLELEHDYGMPWREWFDRFRDMVDGGMRPEIMESGRLIDILEEIYENVSADGVP